MSDTVSTVALVEPDAIDRYVEEVISLLRPLLLARAQAWERLGLVAPPPEALAEKITERWLARANSALRHDT